MGAKGSDIEGLLAGAFVGDAADEQGHRFHLGTKGTRISIVGDNGGEALPIRGELRNHQLRYRKGQTLRTQHQKDQSGIEIGR